MGLDLVIRNGTVVTAAETFTADLGIADGRIAVIGKTLDGGDREIDASGLIVMPGGVDAHCHVDEPSYLGATLADDFASATRAAACGGTTTIVSFANQLGGKSLRAAVEDYHGRAADKALIDYAFHIILSDPSQAVLGQEMPALLQDGYRSFKVFMTYPGYMLDDAQIMDVMETVHRNDGTVMVHAENGHCVHWLTRRLEQEGRTDLSAFPKSAPAVVEREATHRAIALAELTGARVMLVHVSSAQAMEQVAWARDRGLPAMGETCPQYLIDQADRLYDHGWEPAKVMCSPPPRGGDNAERLWAGVARGTFQLLSSDHCPYRFDGKDGKRSGQGSGASGRPDFRHVPPGVPGLETRLPLLYGEGVLKGRISPQAFVALTATNPARTYGLYPRKGTIVPGADADLALWEKAPRTIRHSELHDACDYTPYEGRAVGAWPAITLSRGEVVWNRGWVSDRHGRGAFLKQVAHS
jgi:dihydropyrimidinase